jgi:dienelactone hydrolase
VFACDLYGDGTAGDPDRLRASAVALRDDPALLTRRTRAALAALAGAVAVADRHAAVGFCFGGLAALTLARSGAALSGAVSVHGSLTTSAAARPGAVTARLLVCHGSADPHVGMDQLDAFAAEMDTAGADWQAVVYGGAVHGFTHADAVPGRIPGVRYHPVADRRSFVDICRFLTDVLGLTEAPGASEPRGVTEGRGVTEAPGASEARGVTEAPGVTETRG